MNLEQAADELYRIPPGQFTARRDTLAKDAVRDGERPLGESIKRLRKPTAGAWLANLLARERPREVGSLLGLGAAMRDAQAKRAGDELRRLARERQGAIAELAALARALAAGVGERPGPSAVAELQETLEAAVADPDMAAALRAGALTTGLKYSGLGLVEGAPSPKHTRPSSASHSAAAHRTAEKERSDAKRSAEHAARALQDRERALGRLNDEIVHLERRLSELRAEKRKVEGLVADARRSLDAAQRALRKADQALERLD